jgi:ATP-dependent DNA helicase PIF1
MDKLTPSQRAAVVAIMAGHNVFLTGPGGTGKSFAVETLKEVAPREMKIAVTAMTGCAALLLGGGAKTLHSWAGIGLGRESAGALAAKIRQNKRSKANWLKTDVLVVDEVSMMTAELFEKLDDIGQLLRGSPRPFGGMQVLFIGDFFQLPPVVRGLTPAQITSGEHLAFASPRWATVFDKTIELTEIKRQSDPAFCELLNAVRKGVLQESHLEMLRGRKGLSWQAQPIKPTLLFPRRTEVDEINAANLKALGGPHKTYKVKTAAASARISDAAVAAAEVTLAPLIAAMDTDSQYAAELVLAVGAQVMLVCNLDVGEGLVNGSRGVVTGFFGEDPVVKFLNGSERVIARHPWPVGDDGVIARSQIPLRLAWANTIHKTQGATLDMALIDIGANTFEYGQAYVALSRVKSLDALYVWEIDPRAIKAHPRVVDYYAAISATAPP